jgi:glycine/D-amino acid oxidase-like deaminating enzyme
MNRNLSYWETSILLKPFDFIVLGAGLTGKQVALKIKKKFSSARVAVVDRSAFSYGASTRNAGFACFGSISEFLMDANDYGEPLLLNLIYKRHKGIHQLISEFGADKIGFQPSGGYEMFENKEEFESVFCQLNYYNQQLKACLGINKTFDVLENYSMNKSYFPKSIFNAHEGQLNSGLLNQTIADMMHREGVIPLYGLNIESIDASNNGYTLMTNEGFELLTNQLIVCNNAFASELLPELNVVPARGQIVLTKPIENLSFNGIFHADKGYIYYRTIDNRLLIGGGRNFYQKEETTSTIETTDNLRIFLENYINQFILPKQAFEIDMHWSGIMGMGSEKNPIVKRIDGHLLVAVRMGGMGVALGPVVSDELMALL